MNRISQIAAAAVLAVPLFAVAQTVKPADQPRTNLEKQQTEQNGEALKYGDQSAGSSSQTNHKDKKAAKDSMSNDSMSKSSSKSSMKKDSPSTDTTSTPTPTNTVSPTTTK